MEERRDQARGRTGVRRSFYFGKTLEMWMNKIFLDCVQSCCDFKLFEPCASRLVLLVIILLRAKAPLLHFCIRRTGTRCSQESLFGPRALFYLGVRWPSPPSVRCCHVAPLLSSGESLRGGIPLLLLPLPRHNLSALPPPPPRCRSSTS